MTNPKLTGTARVFCRHHSTCASSLRASATCAATCRPPATTSTVNAPRATKKDIGSAMSARRIFARPFIKHWRPFGGSGWRMNEPRTTPCTAFGFPSGCIGRAATNPANRTAQILDGRSDTRSGLSVHGFHKNQSTSTIRILKITLKRTSFVLKNGTSQAMRNP